MQQFRITLHGQHTDSPMTQKVIEAEILKKSILSLKWTNCKWGKARSEGAVWSNSKEVDDGDRIRVLSRG